MESLSLECFGLRFRRRFFHEHERRFGLEERAFGDEWVESINLMQKIMDDRWMIFHLIPFLDNSQVAVSKRVPFVSGEIDGGTSKIYQLTTLRSKMVSAFKLLPLHLWSTQSQHWWWYFSLSTIQRRCWCFEILHLACEDTPCWGNSSSKYVQAVSGLVITSFQLFRVPLPNNLFITLDWEATPNPTGRTHPNSQPTQNLNNTPPNLP